MKKQEYVVNLKNPEDSPEKIAEKLNTLAYAIDASVIRGGVDRKDYEQLKDKTTKYINGQKERIDTNDLRYHGAGLSAVVHDATLSGNGTIASPLAAVSIPGAGTVTTVSVVTANGLSGTVASATSTPAITLNISALDAAKIANGNVSNIEFQYLDGVTSAIQTQFSGKQDTLVSGTNIKTVNGNSLLGSGDVTLATGTGDVVGPSSVATGNAIPRYNGVTGKIIKDSPITLSDASGGVITIQSQGNFHTYLTNSGDGYDYHIQASNGSTANSFGGLAYLQGGSATNGNADGGSGNVYGGAGHGSGNGGDVILNAGAKGASGIQGRYLIYGNTGTKYAILNAESIASTDKTFTFPNTTGTFALTSDLSPYLTIASATATYVPYSGAITGITLGANDLTLRAITTTSTIELGNATDTTLSRSSGGVLAVEGVVIPSISSTNTLTNKRITRRVTTVASGGAVPSYNTDNIDVLHIYGQGPAITSFTTGASGTPVDGDLFRVSILATAAAGLTWGTNFESSGNVTLPSATVTTNRLDVGFVWNTETGKWRCVCFS